MDSSALLEMINEWHPRLCSIKEQEASVVVGSKWTRQELLGHLLDSALNNHQRFVRLQQGDLEGFPGYDQEHWVSAGGYKQCEWHNLVQLWYLFNQQLALVISNISPSSEGNLWKDKECDLQFLVQDYSHHMLHHLQKLQLQ